MLYRIRPAKNADAVAIIALNEEIKRVREALFSRATRAFHKKIPSAKKPRVPGRLPLTKKDIVFVVEDPHASLVGMIWGTLADRRGRVLGCMGHIEQLVIAASHRRHGLGKKLFRHLAKEFKRRGCDHVVVHTDAENTPARTAYASFGMHETTIELFKKL